MKEPKKISVVYIITQLELGGAQKVCLSLHNGMPAHGIETFLIAGRGQLADTLAPSESVFILPVLQRTVSWATDLQIFFNLIRILKKIKRANAHLIVHTHSTKAGILGRWAAFFARIPRVHTIHGFALHAHQHWTSWILIYLAELITSFITTQYVCVSSYDSALGMQLFPGFNNNYRMIRAAVHWQHFYNPKKIATPYPIDGQPFIFGAIACFKPQKNIIDLFKAFNYVHEHNPHVVLEVIGDGQLRPELEDWIAQHGLAHAIILRGWQQNVAPIMQRWHAFALSSLWEGLPCAVVEARLMKIPVISYATGGIGDVIYDGKNGFLVAQKDWPALAQRMLAITFDQELHTRLQQYPDDLSDFDNGAMIQAHALLYTHLASRF